METLQLSQASGSLTLETLQGTLLYLLASQWMYVGPITGMYLNWTAILLRIWDILLLHLTKMALFHHLSTLAVHTTFTHSMD